MQLAMLSLWIVLMLQVVLRQVVPVDVRYVQML